MGLGMDVGVGVLVVDGVEVGVGVTGTGEEIGPVPEGDMVGSGVARTAGGPGPGTSTGVVVGVSAGDTWG